MSNKQKKDDNFFNKNPLITFAIFSLITIFVVKLLIQDSDFSSQVTRHREISYSELKELIKSHAIREVAIGQTHIKALGFENGHLIAYYTKLVPFDTSLIQLLDENGVRYSGFDESNWFLDMFGWLFPFLILFGLWILFTNRIQKNFGGGMLGMGNKRLINSEKPKTKFSDVAGSEEAKEEVKEIVDFLKYPERYISLGAKIPKGVLLVGPPGTGKTLLAKAVAGEAEVPFFSVAGSSFIEMFVGVGASRVRELFEQAKKDAPAIIFIDEIDAIGKSRATSGIGGGNDEREQTLNQLLAEMDGFNSNLPIIVLAATNRPEILDPALLRPGRFDRQVLVDKPDFQGRIDILNVHIKDYKLDDDVDIKEIARMTAGLAGADLANIVNEAALLAGRKNRESVTQADFKEAVERAIAGLEKKSRRINPKEKKIVAYHESGHALISEITKGAKRVNKVSIVPRGLAALGYTLNTPEENKFLAQKHELLAEVDVLLGGRAAEEIFFQEVSTGASNDLERATDIVKSMVQYYGMSEVAGLMVLEKQRNSFLGNGFGATREFSEETAKKVDKFIRDTLEERYSRVKSLIEKYREAIEQMVASLYETETITGDEVRKIIAEFEKENNLESLLQPIEKENEEKKENSESVEDGEDEKENGESEAVEKESSESGNIDLKKRGEDDERGE
ncbi:MAG TPA: ATP-dependent metallopeptidase FtsH/Yme1/Tma family protein [Campylobacterales bacterium]|nr:ATP-dependent metallopeptidase FtsH/Yme1/Tma family protein [Campylobacterales bacterium]